MTQAPAEVLVITGELTELSRVRQWARTLLGDLAEDMLVDALAVVDELTSNALRHGREPFRVAIRRDRARLRVEVTDGSPQPACPRTPDARGGRGLTLVAAYSMGWGQEALPDGKIVWAELDLAANAAMAGQRSG